MEQMLFVTASAELGWEPEVRAAGVQEAGHPLWRGAHQKLCHQLMAARDAQVELLFFKAAPLLQIAEGTGVEGLWMLRVMQQWHYIRLSQDAIGDPKSQEQAGQGHHCRPPASHLEPSWQQLCTDAADLGVSSGRPG